MTIKEIAERIDNKQPQRGIALLNAEANLLKSYFPELKKWEMKNEDIIMKRYSSDIHNELTAVEPVIIASILVEHGTPEQKVAATQYIQVAEDIAVDQESKWQDVTATGRVGKFMKTQTIKGISRDVSYADAEEMIRKTMGLRDVMPDAEDIVDQFLMGVVTKDEANMMLNDLKGRIVEHDYGNEEQATKILKEAAAVYAPNMGTVRKTPRTRG